jgi:Raf kinase inhibitor-like YbhB/YbcL family protein
MKIESPAFQSGEHIPEIYSRYGDNKNPPLVFRDVPAEARSLAVIVDDPDAPKGIFTHWIIFDLDPTTEGLAENFVGNVGRQGSNGWQEVGYGGPRPPDGEHRNYVRLYALDRKLNLPNGAGRAQFEQALRGRVVAEAELMGKFATPVQAERDAR